VVTLDVADRFYGGVDDGTCDPYATIVGRKSLVIGRVL
jgi:hypothetical protein